MSAPEPPDAEIARQVLTDVQFLTWFMAQRGVSHRAIGYYRSVSKATVTDCLATCDRKIEAAKERMSECHGSAGTTTAAP